MRWLLKLAILIVVVVIIFWLVGHQLPAPV
jgi:hypothetical protein